jgi:hypothetical protein
MCDLLPKARRQAYFDSLGFDNPIDFDRADVGVAGGIQV